MSLRGKRVLVTRAREQAEKTAALIRDKGGLPVLLPAIEVVAPSDPVAVERALAWAAKRHAWAAFTSENGVTWTWTALERAGLGAEAFAGMKLAAIGQGTAAALLARGVRADVVAAESQGEGLAEAVLAAMKPGESLLLLRARGGRDAFPDAVTRAGHAVEIVAVYETRPARGPEAARVVAMLEDGLIDAATFSSASTVESFCALAGGAPRAKELLGRTLVGSIGPITSEALAAHGIRVDVTPAETTLPALLAALEEALGAREGGQGRERGEE